MSHHASTVEEYLAALPGERRVVLETVRAVIRRHLDPRYAEGIQYGMIGYYVPHALYPPGYHCDPSQPVPFAGLAAQKNHYSLHLFCLYIDPPRQRWFRAAWARTGKRLDLGKSCVRFRQPDDLALEVIGEMIRRVPVEEFLTRYEAVLAASRRPRSKAGAGGNAGRPNGVRPRKTATPRNRRH